jgi:hypothetical protein
MRIFEMATPEGFWYGGYRSEGRLQRIDRDGVSKWDKVLSTEDWPRHTGHAYSPLFSVLPTESGKLWIALKPGLYLFDPETCVWKEVPRTV